MTEKPEKLDKTKTEDGARHPAGPHAKPELTNEDATPGTGSLPDVSEDADAEGGTG